MKQTTMLLRDYKEQFRCLKLFLGALKALNITNSMKNAMTRKISMKVTVNAK